MCENPNMNVVSRHVLGMGADTTSYDDASEQVVRWARSGRSAFVCGLRAYDHGELRLFGFSSGRKQRLAGRA